MLCSFTLILPEVCVQKPAWLFSVFPLLLAIQVGSAIVFWMIKRCFQLFPYFGRQFCLQIPQTLYFYYMVLRLTIFSALFLIKFVSPEYGTFINIIVLLSLSRTMMSGLLFEWFCQFALCTCSIFVSQAMQTRTIRCFWNPKFCECIRVGHKRIRTPLNSSIRCVHEKKQNNFHWNLLMWNDLTYTFWTRHCNRSPSARAVLSSGK
jgi:hypothetical protein